MRKFNLRTIILATAIATGISPWSTTFAASATCIAPVAEVGAHKPDSLTIKLSNTNFLVVCSLTAAGQAASGSLITPEGCRLFSALAAQAKATGANVTLIVDNAPTTDCSSMPNWFGAQVRYLSQ